MNCSFLIMFLMAARDITLLTALRPAIRFWKRTIPSEGALDYGMDHIHIGVNTNLQYGHNEENC